MLIVLSRWAVIVLAVRAAPVLLLLLGGQASRFD
jgi:hypothetical protein